MQKTSAYTAVILAGGKNSRFHRYDKAFIRVFGIPMIERVFKVLSQIFDDIIVVTNSPEKYSEYRGVKLLGDSILDAGPLGGLHSALKHLAGKTIFFVSCDMPFLNKGIIIKQLEDYSKTAVDILIPEHEGYFEPMHSVLSGKLFPEIEDFLNESSDKTLLNFFLGQNHKIWKPEGLHKCLNPFLNINSYQELGETGIYGYLSVLGFGKEVTEVNRLIASELGALMARAGWGFCVGNTEGIFRAAKEACLNDGGIAKLVYASDDVSGKFNNWPLVEETKDVEHKHTRIAEISMAAIVIGGGEGSLSLVRRMLQSGKPVVYISGTGGITQNKIPGIVVKNSPREAVEYLNTLL